MRRSTLESYSEVRPGGVRPYSSRKLCCKESDFPGLTSVWGKLFVDEKFLGDVEGSRRFTVPSGVHDIRLTNGRRAKAWPQTEVKPGKSLSLQHSFLDE